MANSYLKEIYVTMVSGFQCLIFCLILRKAPVTESIHINVNQAICDITQTSELTKKNHLMKEIFV